MARDAIDERPREPKNKNKRNRRMAIKKRRNKKKKKMKQKPNRSDEDIVAFPRAVKDALARMYAELSLRRRLSEGFHYVCVCICIEYRLVGSCDSQDDGPGARRVIRIARLVSDGSMLELITR